MYLVTLLKENLIQRFKFLLYNKTIFLYTKYFCCFSSKFSLVYIFFLIIQNYIYDF